MGFLVAGLLLTAAPSASAEAPECSYGDAAALLQAFPPLYIHQSDGSYPSCQYRIFLGGEDFTFGEDDWFLAGSVSFYDYKAAGATRVEAIAELEKWDDRLWLAEMGPGGTIGAPVEQTLTSIGYRNAVSPELGLVVYRQEGIVLRLPPGDYLSIHEGSYEGVVVEHNEVTLHILPVS